jgi:hypothetical protein
MNNTNRKHLIIAVTNAVNGSVEQWHAIMVCE